MVEYVGERGMTPEQADAKIKGDWTAEGKARYELYTALLSTAEAAGSVGVAAPGNAVESTRRSAKQSDDAGSGGSPFRSGTPEPKKGSATAKYRPNDDGSPHFTVEVRTSDGKSFETHQVLTARKGRKTE